MTYSVSPKRVAEDCDGLGEAHIEDRREYSRVNKVFDIDKFRRKKSKQRNSAHERYLRSPRLTSQ